LFAYALNRSNAYAWSVYLKGDDGSLTQDWKVSLLVDPPAETLERLPKTYIQIATKDILRDEGKM
jgi:acetyl esterase/lipase